MKLLSQNIPNALFISALGLFWDKLSWTWGLGYDSYAGHILGSCFETCLNGLWLFQGAPDSEEEARTRGCPALCAAQRKRWQTVSLGGSAPRRKACVSWALTLQTMAPGSPAQTLSVVCSGDWCVSEFPTSEWLVNIRKSDPGWLKPPVLGIF